MNELISSFRPTDKIKELRSNQISALTQVFNLLEAGHKLIEIEAPPGSGKSLLADTIMNYFVKKGKHCIVTSPTNDQVDQYASAGFGMVTLKGREHYRCLAGRRNASEGFCCENICTKGPEHERKCDRKQDLCKRCICWNCLYKGHHHSFIRSKKANTNFTLYMIGKNNHSSVVIIDEADTCEDEIRRMHTIVVPELFKHFRFPEILPELVSYAGSIKSKLSLTNASKQTKTSIEDTLYLESLEARINNMIKDYEKHKEPWCITTKSTLGKTRFEPVTISRFLEKVLGDKIIIMMSATPPHYPGFQKVRVESIFPVSSRQWIYDPFPGSLTMNQREASLPRAAVWLKWLKGKTIVHCKSYKTAEKLHTILFSIGCSSLLQVNKGDDTEKARYSRYDAIKAFLSSKNEDEILISVNQGRGLDLWQPEIINNVILVVPWQNPTDPLTKMKCQIIGEAWKNKKTADDITQAIARHFRNEKMGVYKGTEVPKRAYIIDASFGNWYLRNRELFPKNFVESQKI